MEGEIKGNKQLSDEPQHKDQGMITTSMLKTINIKYKILDKKTNFKHVFSSLKSEAIKSSKPVALLVRKNVFTIQIMIKKKSRKKIKIFSREDALITLMSKIPKNSKNIYNWNAFKGIE